MSTLGLANTYDRPDPQPPDRRADRRFDPTACLDERVRHSARPAGQVEPGRYVEVQGPERALLIPLGLDAMRIGRGLGADLHLDESSSRGGTRSSGAPRGREDPRRSQRQRHFVNGRRVQQADLSDGDVIVLGRVVLRYLEL